MYDCTGAISPFSILCECVTHTRTLWRIAFEIGTRIEKNGRYVYYAVSEFIIFSFGCGFFPDQLKFKSNWLQIFCISVPVHSAAHVPFLLRFSLFGIVFGFNYFPLIILSHPIPLAGSHENNVHCKQHIFWYAWGKLKNIFRIYFRSMVRQITCINDSCR